MLFGTCCFLKHDAYQDMSAKSIKINGFQQSLIVNFEVEQSFYHQEENLQEICYIFPNDFKICIYDITFVVGEEIIKPMIKSKIEAKKTYDEAVESGRTAVFGTNIGHGMTKLTIGNVQPNVECKVILKMVFTGQMTSEKSFFIKFPIDVYNCGGSCGCLQIGNKSEFLFHLQTNEEEISKVTSNVKNSKFDESTHLFSIENKLENNENEHSIILTFRMKEDIKSLCLISPKNSDKFDSCALLISPNFSANDTLISKEFIFVIDCSYSMNGISIKKASECLNIFIKSLPYNCYFNIIRFGSNYEKLFNDSVLYDDKTSKKAIDLACNLKADLGCTDIYSPLNNLFSQKALHGQRQVFIMTDGEVSFTEAILELVSNNSNDNRCFSIGIGRCCDAGLVEGIAAVSGGTCDFVQEGDSIADKVIPQLQSSLNPNINCVEVFVEGESNDAFEVAPFPIPSINVRSSSFVYLRHKKKDGKSFNDGILITGNYVGDSVEIPIIDFVNLVNVDEDKYGRSFGKNIGNAIIPLFAFSIIQKFERKKETTQSDEEKEKIIKLSIESGVLCKYTGYVGFTEDPVMLNINDNVEIVESESGRKYRRKKGSAKSTFIGGDETEPRRKHKRKVGEENTESTLNDGFVFHKRRRRDREAEKESENNETLEKQEIKEEGEVVHRRRRRRTFEKESENNETLEKPETKEEEVVHRRRRRRTFEKESENNETLEKPEIKEEEVVHRRRRRRTFEKESENNETLEKPEIKEEEVVHRRRRRRTFEKESENNETLEKQETKEEEVVHRKREAENEHEDDDEIQRRKSETIQEDVVNYDLMTLISYQKAGGFWDDLDAVKEITGIKISKIDEINLDDKNIENICIGTIIAIAAMRVKSSDSKNSWIMIETKALSWLKMTLPDVDIDQIISKIENSIT